MTPELTKAEERYRRNVEIHQAKAENPSLSQQAIAERFGMPRETVRNVLAEKPVRTEKPARPSREFIRVQINAGTDARTAARKIIRAAHINNLRMPRLPKPYPMVRARILFPETCPTPRPSTPGGIGHDVPGITLGKHKTKPFRRNPQPHMHSMACGEGEAPGLPPL